MLIVIGHLVVDPAHRDAHLATSASAVRLARAAPGCLHFAVGADVVDPARVDVAERWATRADLDAFRATDDGSTDDPFAHVREFHVEEFEVEPHATADRLAQPPHGRQAGPMVDFGKLAKQAQDALAQGADKLETAVKDNAGKIEGAVDRAGQFAKDKMPDRAAQIDNATQKAKAAVPRHQDGTSSTPDIPLATDTPTAAAAPTQTAPPPAAPLPTHTAPDASAPSWSPPGSTPTAPSPTPEVDRAARDQG